MSSDRSSLPEYAHPPLVAATLGVSHVETPALLDPAALQRYRAALGPEWNGEWEPANPSSIVRAHQDAGYFFRGVQLRNLLEDRQIRISEGHFGFTWHATEVGLYPRYENLRDGFVSAWDQWCLQDREADIDVKSWFVVYLNRIPRGTVWQSLSDLSFLRLFGKETRILNDRPPYTFHADWRYQLSDVPASLLLSFDVDGGCGPDAATSLWVRLVVVSNPLAAETISILDGMDAGRRAIVQTFSDLMSPAANAYWGLRRRDK